MTMQHWIAAEFAERCPAERWGAANGNRREPFDTTALRAWNRPASWAEPKRAANYCCCAAGWFGRRRYRPFALRRALIGNLLRWQRMWAAQAKECRRGQSKMQTTPRRAASARKFGIGRLKIAQLSRDIAAHRSRSAPMNSEWKPNAEKRNVERPNCLQPASTSAAVCRKTIRAARNTAKNKNRAGLLPYAASVSMQSGEHAGKLGRRAGIRRAKFGNPSEYTEDQSPRSAKPLAV
jgi:hypothetical protein